jgi:peptidoglycan/xylan/chitin deacetylase (PgdA/CDA1 family)
MDRFIQQGSSEQKHYAFTFDDGTTFVPIEPWFEALEQNGAAGTFFFTGEWLDRYPHKARELIARGHELAPHTYHHRRMAEVSKEVFFEELKQTELAYQDATGLPCPLFMRFPYRSFSEECMDWLDELGYVDIEGENSEDWSGITADEIVNNLQPTLRNGAILVLHCNDIAKGTPEAVKKVANIAASQGLTPVKISELLTSMGRTPKYRKWNLSIEVPESNSFPTVGWEGIVDINDLQQLASELTGWGIPQIPGASGEEKSWLQKCKDEIAEPSSEGSNLFCTARYHTNQYWAFVVAEVKDDTLILYDFATKEFTADAMVYMLRWAAETAAARGCKHIVAKREMRRLSTLCRQMGWASELKAE